MKVYSIYPLDINVHMDVAFSLLVSIIMYYIRFNGEFTRKYFTHLILKKVLVLNVKLKRNARLFLRAILMAICISNIKVTLSKTIAKRCFLS